MRPKDNLKIMYYHVTMETNSESIREVGLDPSRATGKMKVSWVVLEERVLWAIAHVSARHHVSVDHLIVCEVPAPTNPYQMKRFNRPGIFTSPVPLATGYHMSAMAFIEKLG